MLAHGVGDLAVLPDGARRLVGIDDLDGGLQVAKFVPAFLALCAWAEAGEQFLEHAAQIAQGKIGLGRVGKEGEGWQIICSALQNERSGIAEVNRHHKALERLIDLANESQIAGKPAIEDAELRRSLSRFSATIEAARLNGLRTLTRQVRGELTQSDASINKLHNCNLLVAMAELGMELLGGASPYVGDTEASLYRGRWQVGALGWPTTVIGGGTPNIQKNIIAERLLGLPKD